MRLLYHSTFRSNLPDIKKYGLGAKQRKNWDISQDGVVCFSENSEVAFSYCETAEDVPDWKYNSGIGVLAVSVGHIDKTKIKLDGNISQEPGLPRNFVYSGIVKPENLYVMTSNKGIVGKLMELKRVPSYELSR